MMRKLYKSYPWMDSPVRETIEVIYINFNVNKILINKNLGLLDPMHEEPQKAITVQWIICENTDE